MKQTDILPLRLVDRSSYAEAGFRAAYLAELAAAKLPIVVGFSVTKTAFEQFIKVNRLTTQIQQQLKSVNTAHPESAHRAAVAIQKLILNAPLPRGFLNQLETFYHDLAHKAGELEPVSLSLDRTTDTPDDPHRSDAIVRFNRVVGFVNLAKALKHAWASYFDSQALFGRVVHDLDHGIHLPAVWIQLAPGAVTSGFVYTMNPVSGNPDEVIIEAAYGKSETITHNEIAPDRYVVSKTQQKILDSQLAAQPWQLTDGATGLSHQSIPKERRRQAKLSEDDVLTLSEIGIRAEKRLGSVSTLAWIKDAQGVIWISEAWPAVGRPEVSADLGLPAILRGRAASPGFATGAARSIHRVAQLSQIKPGEVLVLDIDTKLPPQFSLLNVAGLILEGGKATDQLIKLAHEHGIPAVVATGRGRHLLKDATVVTVDGHAGVVYRGALTPQQLAGEHANLGIAESPITATKILAAINTSRSIGSQAADGVGALRGSTIIATAGRHPYYYLHEGRQEQLQKILVGALREVASDYVDRPVFYQAVDLSTNVYKRLSGGAKIEPTEQNPAMGYQGLLRTLREPELFALELEALAVARKSYDLTHLSLTLPPARTVEELLAAQDLVKSSNLSDSPDFKIWLSVAIPSNIFLFDAFLRTGVDGVVLDLDGLTESILFLDRDNPKVAADFNRKDVAVVGAIRHMIELARRHSVAVSVDLGDTAIDPELVETFVRAGATGLIVPSEMTGELRRLVASIERRLLLDIRQQAVLDK